MSKKKIFISGMIISLFLLFGICGYAYFIKAIDNTHNISSTLTEENVVEVATVDDFYEAIKLYDKLPTTGIPSDEFNSDSVVSTTAKRKKIILTADIELTADALVTADCHINLNGKSINLNGYDLIFKHQFEGTFAVYNGTITDLSEDIVVRDETGTVVSTTKPEYGKVVIDCPNACIDITATYGDMIKTDAINSSATQVVNSAMKLVYSNIQNGAVNDFYTTIDTVEDYGKDVCGDMFAHTTNSTSCIYTHTDLDLIYNYFAYEGLKITYASSDTSVLTNGGKVLSTATTTTVSLTVTISYNDATITKVVDVHVLAPADYVKASNCVLQQYLKQYYNVDESKYIFNKTFQLPKENEYFGTTYIYTLYKVNSDNTVTSYSSSSPTDFFDTSGTYVSVGLSKEISGLTITSTDSSGNTSTTDQMLIEGEASSVIDDNYSYAVNIVQNLYGNQIVIKDGQKNTLSGYSEHQLLINKDLNGYSRLKSMTNGLVNNSEGTYIITQYTADNKYHGNYELLHVDTNSDTMPYLSQTVYLAITFNFTESYNSDVIVVQIPIVYEPLEDGEGFDPFDPYYVYFDKEFTSRTNNFTYESFDIPLSYEGRYPTYAYVIYVENADNTYTKITNNNLFTTSLSTGSTYTSFTKDSLMEVTINPYYANDKDTKYYFAYIPVYIDTEDNVIYYTPDGTTDDLSTVNVDVTTYPYISELTIPGIVRYDTNYLGTTYTGQKFADKEFYKIAYELINGKGSFKDEDLNNDGIKEPLTFILSATLSNYIELVDFSIPVPELVEEDDPNTPDIVEKVDKDLSLLSSVNYGYSMTLGTVDNDDNIISSLKGIELLTGINELTFNGTNLGANANFVTNLGYVSQITNLTKLDLGNTNIYDQQPGILSFPNGNDNGILTTLSALTNLKELNLENNKIYDFNALSSFASLEYVNIGGNEFTANSGFNLQILDDILTILINALYGTNGATNSAVIASLRANGVTVDGTENQDISEGTLAVVNALSSLEYQDRVSKNIDLDNVISQYSTAPTTYGVVSYVENNVKFSFTSVQFVANDENVNGEFSATSFTMIINCKWEYSPSGWEGVLVGSQSGDIQYTYKYKVTRY